MAKLLTGTRIYGTGTVDTQLFVSGTNSATSTTTGALQVVGGVGIGGNLYVGGTIFGGILSGTASTSTNADNIKTVLQVSSATYYPTFVDANNSTAAYEALYTTSSFNINPATGAVGIVGTSTAIKLQIGQGYGGITYASTSNIKIIGNPNNNTDEIFINLVRDRNPGVQFAGAASITLGSYIVPTSASAPSSRLTFLLKNTTDNTDVANVSVMSLLDTGNVGIGTTLPTARLQLGGQAGSVATPLALQFSNDYSSGSTALGSKIFLYNTGGTEVYGIGVGPTSDIQYHAGGASNTAGKHIWYVANSEKLRITTNGGIAFSGASNYGVSGQILQSNGDAAPTWISTGSLAAANATTATHLSGGTAGQVPYQTAPGVTSFYGPGTAGNVLVSNGTGAPTYNNTLTLTGTTNATSTTTGALQVVGGVGVGGDLFIRGDILTNDTTFSLINTNATTVNFAGAATTLTMGASGSGTTNVRNNLTVSGNLTVQGTTTIVDSTVTNIADPIITLGGGTGDTAPTADDNKDRGVAFKWVNNGGTTSTGFFGYDDSTGYFTYVQTATITNEVVSGTKGAMDVNLAGGTAMSIVYQSSPNNTGFLAASTSGYILQTNGTGSPPTWVSASGVSAGSAANADSIRTIAQTASASYYPTFVDSNNASNAYELVYTTSSFTINPQSGNVGIGTTSPGSKLEIKYGVQGALTLPLTLNPGFYQAGSATGIGFLTDGDTTYTKGALVYKSNATGWNIGDFQFLMRNDNNTNPVTLSDAVMTIYRNGNVGIGNTAPTYKLVVSTSVAASATTASSIALHLFNTATDGSSPPNQVGIGFGQSTTRSAIVAGTYGNDYIDFFNNGDITTPKVRMAASGAIAFSGVTNYGSSGQILQSNGNAAPTWVSPGGITGVNADQVRTIAQTANATYYPAFVDSNNASNAYELVYTTSSFVINPQSGNVGIGAATPGFKLDVNGVGNFASGVQVGASAGLSFGASKWMIQSETSSLIRSYSCGPDTSTYSSWEHYTARSNGTPVSLMRWDANGNVGIGTSSPPNKLTISNNGAVGLEITPTGGYTGLSGVDLLAYNRSTSAYAPIGFITNSSNNSMVILTSGNVGVGTTTPAARLDVLSGTGASGGLQVALTGEAYGPNTTSSRSSIYDLAGTIVRIGANPNSVATGALINFNAYNASNGATGAFAGAVAGSTGNGPAHFVIGRRTAAQTWAETFRITQNGGVSFGTSGTAYGTSGQMLQSNGDAAPTWIDLSSRTVGTSTQVNTVLQTASASYFPTFVDSNNAAATAESLYTTSSFSINPGTGLLTVTKTAQIGTTVAQGDPSATDITANATLLLSGIGGNYLSFGQKASNLAQWIQSGYLNPTTAVYPISLNPLGGNVGIGTLTPGAPLAFADSVAVKIQLNGNNANGYQIGLASSVNGGDAMMKITAGVTGAGEIGFYNTTNLRLLINNAGNVGIGTSTPNDKLQVQTSSATAYDATNDQGQYGSGAGITVTNLDETSQSFAQINLQVSANAGRAVGRIVAIRTASATSDLAFVTENANTKAEKMRIFSNGNVSIGTTSTTNKFEVAGTAGQLFSVSDSFTGTIFSANDVSGIPSIEVLDTGLVKLAQYNGAVTIGTGTVSSSTAELSVYGMLYTSGAQGEIRASSEITAYFSSDQRLKENIKLIENPITIIDQIRGVTFDWTDEHMARRGGEDGYFVRKHDIGVIAQEVQAVLPELVGTREDGYLAVKYEKMVPLLIEAIKSQQKTIDTLTSEIKEIKEFLSSLKNN